MATDPQQQLLQSPVMQALAARRGAAGGMPGGGQVPGRAQILQRMLAQARQRSAQPAQTVPPLPPQQPQPYRPGLPGQPIQAAGNMTGG